MYNCKSEVPIRSEKLMIKFTFKRNVYVPRRKRRKICIDDHCHRGYCLLCSTINKLTKRKYYVRSNVYYGKDRKKM